MANDAEQYREYLLLKETAIADVVNKVGGRGGGHLHLEWLSKKSTRLATLLSFRVPCWHSPSHSTLPLRLPGPPSCRLKPIGSSSFSSDPTN